MRSGELRNGELENGELRNGELETGDVGSGAEACPEARRGPGVSSAVAESAASVVAADDSKPTAAKAEETPGPHRPRRKAERSGAGGGR